MATLETLWWLGFWTAIGLCVGSFLNVVIYRLPRNRSLRNPIWSACPRCDNRIRWYDNLPIISFMLLGRRCRQCRSPIGTNYPVIEATMALIVLLLLDSFCVAGARAGLRVSEFGLTDRFAYDWPILASHVILFACLLSMSAVDLEHYWVDIRFTNFATICGFLFHIIWTPKHSQDWLRPSDTVSAMALMAIIGLAVVWLVSARSPHGKVEESSADQSDDDAFADRAILGGEEAAEELAETETNDDRSPRYVVAWLAAGLLVGLFAVVAFADRDSGRGFLPFTIRTLVPIVFFFALIVSQAMVTRDSDDEIMDAIDEERHEARGMVMKELALLVPAIGLACVGLWVMFQDGAVASWIRDTLHYGFRVGEWSMFRNWSPFLGFATAAAGYVIAGALGWFVRIVFTLVFGKEAFGVGDIHLMAAAGCVAGWPVVVLGFFLTCFLALVGWLVCFPTKRTRAIPLGPWLSLSFLIVVVFYDSILQWPVVQRFIVVCDLVFT